MGFERHLAPRPCGLHQRFGQVRQGSQSWLLAQGEIGGRHHHACTINDSRCCQPRIGAQQREVFNHKLRVDVLEPLSEPREMRRVALNISRRLVGPYHSSGVRLLTSSQGPMNLSGT